MADSKKSTLARMAGEITGVDALAALNQLVTAARESIEIHETESTKREKLRTYRETEVRRIKSSEKMLQQYFDQIFAERAVTHGKLFAGLDVALERGDTAALQTIVGGIVEVARTSPLAGMGDIAQLKRAMEDPDAVFDL
jgi:fructose-1,6-bisphosphatase/sedoheptulose 1,7-bisphosphatase-like protein